MFKETLYSVVCFIDNLNEQLQNHNGMNNYDTWLSQPYEDHYYEAEKERLEREYHLERIEGLTEEEIEDYLFAEDIEDPRKYQR